MRIVLTSLIPLAFALAACAAAPASAPTLGAPALEITPAPTRPPTLLPTTTPEPPSATPAPTAAPTTPPPPSLTPAPTAPPTEPPTPTAPLFLEPTARPDAAPPTTAAPTATAVPSASAAPAAATAAPATATPQAALAQQPATDGTRPARLTVEAIGLDKPLVPVGLDSNRYPVVPDHDVGWYIHSARPGAGENIVLWAHVLRFRATPHIPAPFARLKELKAGDRVTLFDTQGIAYRYIVTQQVWATPDQIEYMLPRGREQVTMISCIGEKVILDGSTTDMTHRLITIAEPED